MTETQQKHGKPYTGNYSVMTNDELPYVFVPRVISLVVVVVVFPQVMNAFHKTNRKKLY